MPSKIRIQKIIYHHGVKGQRKGIRNGPPYPINRNKLLIPKSVKTKSKDGVSVTGISEHAKEQAAKRKVDTNGIVSAIEKPLHIREDKVDEFGRKSREYIGADATVSLNPDTGNIVTVWPTSSRRRKKYSKGE